jgi:SAM-dependent methyltransferase
MNIEELRRGAREFERSLEAKKKACAPGDFPWYPYGTLSNFVHLERLLSGGNRDLGALIGGRPVADVGAADGDLAFYLEGHGVAPIDVVDYAPTNYNSLRGARLLAAHLGSRVAIHEKDLDSYFDWPRDDYGLVFFLGILYHLKNPYFVLESLARATRHCLISTRIARLAGDRVTSIRDQPLAYLLAPDECNNDATNFWIFSEQGLRRIFERTGWEVLDYVSVGDTRHSDPASREGDERAFALLRSRHASG